MTQGSTQLQHEEEKVFWCHKHAQLLVNWHLKDEMEPVVVLTCAGESQVCLQVKSG